MADTVSGAQVGADIASFRWNEHNLTELLHGTHGPVIRDLVRRGILVEASAKQHASGRPGPNVQSGRLRASITWRLGEDAASPYVDIGTNVEYGGFVEEGTRYMPAYPYLRPGLEAARSSF